MIEKATEVEILDALRKAGHPLDRHEFFLHIFLNRCELIGYDGSNIERSVTLLEFYDKCIAGNVLQTVWAMIDQGKICLNFDRKLELPK